MSIYRYVVLVLVLVVLGVLAVWSHFRLISAGYETSELRNRKARLEEETHLLERRIEAATGPEIARRKAARLRLRLLPPKRPEEEQ